MSVYLLSACVLRRDAAEHEPVLRGVINNDVADLTEANVRQLADRLLGPENVPPVAFACRILGTWELMIALTHRVGLEAFPAARASVGFFDVICVMPEQLESFVAAIREPCLGVGLDHGAEMHEWAVTLLHTAIAARDWSHRTPSMVVIVAERIGLSMTDEQYAG